MGARPDALRQAIEDAWRVFDLPAPKTTGVCEQCCMDPDIEADFLQQLACDLPADYVRDWYFAACADDITHHHVAWLLPRVMEMLADDEDVAAVGNEVAFQRLPQTGFPQNWSRHEVDAINRFALAWFEKKLHDPPQFVEHLDSWLCMFGEGGIDIRPLLLRIEALPDGDLANLLHRNWFVGSSGHIPVNPFWSRQPAKALAWNWYTSGQLLARMERAALAGHERAREVHDLIAMARANDRL